MNKIMVELFSASHCSRCVKAKEQVQALVAEINKENDTAELIYREVDIVENIDYCVQLGVIGTPSIAINSVLTFNQIPSLAALTVAITLASLPSEHCKGSL